MEWTELSVEVHKDDSSQAGDIITSLADNGFAIEDYGNLQQDVLDIAHVDLIEEALLEKPKDIVRFHIYLSPEDPPGYLAEQLHSRFAATGLRYRFSSQQVQQEDWENAWKQYYHAINIGEKLIVVPSWETCNSERVQLHLDPGMAFGTGTHETTLLCLEVLERVIQGGETLLDIGTGSGILAIAAILLGAKNAVAIDIDPLCVRTTKENAQRNGVLEHLQVIEGDLASAVSDRYPVITANLVADVILRLAPSLPSLLEPGGLFIASGVLTQRAEEVRTALENTGLIHTEICHKNDWVAIMARLPKTEN